MTVADALAEFKAFVAAVEFKDDTLALDTALAEASRLLYDTRHAIDFEWAAARSVGQGAKPRSSQTVSDLIAFINQESKS
jgi:hypothetical protein